MSAPPPAPIAALRPLAIAGRPSETPLALLCLLGLLAVLAVDLTTPVEVAVSGLGLLPLLAAMWLLSDRWAYIVGAVAIGQLLLTAFAGALNPITVSSEVVAYGVLAIVCRGCARGVASLLHPRIEAAPTRPIRGMESLTRRERQVVALASLGQTAREIGAELHIGKRTVETHLVNAYDKLGVRSKRELMRTLPPELAGRSADT
ncbi:MAG TPA: LuxR C-terminal-related transcriptional regulator [Candidatus Limnocylindrales bacterium]|nr:LuxR C-terminal-related transcriptional regulator [Candidatus Limnocylindrales bacterium]